jgi:phospholipid/cholesterol/gamma-HCH transport system ATP-binding protein
LNDSLGITSVVVSHDVNETFVIADHVVILAYGGVAAQGTPAQLRASTDPLIYQFVNALSDGPVPFHYPAPPIARDYDRRSP